MNDRERLIELIDKSRVKQGVYMGLNKPISEREVRAVDEN